MTNTVYGPYIEYDCVKCGCVVKANAPRNDERLVNLIASLNNNPEERVCAGCKQWGESE